MESLCCLAGEKHAVLFFILPEDCLVGVLCGLMYFLDLRFNKTSNCPAKGRYVVSEGKLLLASRNDAFDLLEISLLKMARKT